MCSSVNYNGYDSIANMKDPEVKGIEGGEVNIFFYY